MFETITKFAGYLEHVTFLTYPITMFLGFLSALELVSTICSKAMKAGLKIFNLMSVEDVMVRSKKGSIFGGSEEMASLKSEYS